MSLRIRNKSDLAIIDVLMTNLNEKNMFELKKCVTNLIEKKCYNIALNLKNVKEVGNSFFDFTNSISKRLNGYTGNLNLFNVNLEIMMLLCLFGHDNLNNIYLNEIDAVNDKRSLKSRRFKVV